MLNLTITPGTDNGSTFSTTLTASNPNTSYAWNGFNFDIFGIICNTTGTVSGANTPNGPAQFTNNGNGTVTFNLTWQSMFPLNTTIPITVTGTDNGGPASLTNCVTHYVYGDPSIYAQYLGLPASWAKNKPNLSASDLIADPTSYYQTTLSPVADKMIIYNPPHPTQIELNQTTQLNGTVNVESGIRIWIPSRFMAMGLGWNYEFFKLNPNFHTAIGTKENFSAGFVPAANGLNTNPITIDGLAYNWPIVGNSPDGPFQQETGKFNDCVSYFPDYFAAGAQHANYTTINVTSTNRDDPAWISAAISSGISLTVTRETLNAIPAADYVNFIHQIHDPWGEQSVLAFGYNRGINSLLPMHIFTTNRAQALASTNIANDFNLAGFASYVQQVQTMTDALNNDTSQTYDAQISWSDMQTFFTQLQKFYGNGVPDSATFSAMQNDTQRAFNVLAQHWGGSTVSYRYDFLTLLRVMKQYLPQPYNARPTGANWYYLIINAQP